MSKTISYKSLWPKDRLYKLFVSYFWLFEYFSAFWRRIGVEVTIANFLVFIILALTCIDVWYKRVRIFDAVLYVFLAMSYILSASIYPKTNYEVFDKAFEVICATIPFIFVGLLIKLRGNEKLFTSLSRFAVVINVLYSFYSPVSDDVEEQMHRAYILLPSVLYLLWCCFEHFKTIDSTLFVIGFLLECSMGSRGPFVCIIFFATSYLFFFKEYKYSKALRPVIVGIAMILYFLSPYIANFMVLLLSAFGKSTRIFDMMADSSLIDYENSNGRNVIQEDLMNHLNKDSGGVGFGLFSDRQDTGFYSHNIFIELWYSFGYVIGSIIVCSVLLLFCVFLLKVKNRRIKIFALIFFTASFVKLNFSGSFILDQSLFFLIGYCISALRERKKTMRLKVNNTKITYNDAH